MASGLASCPAFWGSHLAGGQLPGLLAGWALAARPQRSPRQPAHILPSFHSEAGRRPGRPVLPARYVEGRHSATRIHPELPPWAVGDSYRWAPTRSRPCPRSSRAGTWWAQETVVLRPLPGGKTRLIARYCGIGILVTGRARHQPRRRARAAAGRV